MYGDLVGRLIAAQQGRSLKCLVLDLDNTLWGGVVGDDGLEGLVLGQGSALGEAFVAFQDYARELSRRGVILAVCSKNDEANALEPFEKHPEMVLQARPTSPASSPTGPTRPPTSAPSPQQLNIGLDSLVFVDDNPFERNLVRQELPMVAVPEVDRRSGAYPQIAGRCRLFRRRRRSPTRTASAARQYQGNRAARGAAGLGHRPAGLSARPGDAADLAPVRPASACSAPCS